MGVMGYQGIGDFSQARLGPFEEWIRVAWGIEVIKTRTVRPGTLYFMSGKILMSDRDRLRVSVDGIITGIYTPLYSRYTLGERERRIK